MKVFRGKVDERIPVDLNSRFLSITVDAGDVTIRELAAEPEWRPTGAWEPRTGSFIKLDLDNCADVTEVAFIPQNLGD